MPRKERVYSQQQIKCGYGRCSKCGCGGFEGNTSMCSNCGHSYGSHY